MLKKVLIILFSLFFLGAPCARCAYADGESIFSNATVQGNFWYIYYYEQDSPELDAVTYNGALTYPAVLFGPDYYDEGLEEVDITITLSQPFLWSQYPIYRYGEDANILGATLVTNDNQRYQLQSTKLIDGTKGYYLLELVNKNIDTNIYVKKIELHYGRAYDTFLNSGLFVGNQNYFDGYNNGYNTGYDDGTTAGRQEGYTSGYNAGESAGYSAGYNAAMEQGIAGENILTATWAFVATCFELTSTMLSTKIAGDLTIGLFVIGIPATFFVIDMVIGLVKRLIGGGGKDNE